MAQNFKVTLLGTGYPRPVMARFGPSILVEAGAERLLFDCGRGATQRLYQLEVPFSDVNLLFLTHLHSDHTVGIPDFWLSGWILGRKALDPAVLPIVNVMCPMPFVIITTASKYALGRIQRPPQNANGEQQQNNHHPLSGAELHISFSDRNFS